MKRQATRIVMLLLGWFSIVHSQENGNYGGKVKNAILDILKTLIDILSSFIWNSQKLFSLYIYPFIERVVGTLAGLVKHIGILLSNTTLSLVNFYNDFVGTLHTGSPTLSIFLKIIPALILLGIIISPLNLITKPVFIHAIREIKYFTGRVGKRFVILSMFFLTLAFLATAADGVLFYFLLGAFSQEKGSNFIIILLSLVVPLIMALTVDAILVQVGGIYLKSFFYYLFHMHDEWEEFLHRIQMAEYRRFPIVPFTHVVRTSRRRIEDIEEQDEGEKRYVLVNWLGALFSISVGAGLLLLMLVFLFAWGVSRNNKEDLVYVLLGRENYFLAIILSLIIFLFGIILIEIIRRGKLSAFVDKFIPKENERLSLGKLIAGFLVILLISLLIVILIKWIPNFLNYVVDGIFSLAPIKGISYSIVEGILFYVTLGLLILASVTFTYILYRSHTLFETFNEKFFAILTSLFFVLVVLGAFLVNITRGDFLLYNELSNKIQNIEKKIDEIKGSKATSYIIYDKERKIDLEATKENIEKKVDDKENREQLIGDVVNLYTLIQDKQAYEKEMKEIYGRVSIPFSIGLAFITSALAYVAGITFYLSIHILGGGLAFYILLLLGTLRLFTLLAAFPIALVALGPLLVALFSIAIAGLFFKIFYGTLTLRKILSDRLNTFREDGYKEGFIDGMYMRLEERRK